MAHKLVEQALSLLLTRVWYGREACPTAAHSTSTPMFQSQDKEEQKKAWLAQEKMAWFERRRSVWEADGKSIPWAEWLARREYEWTVTELPNRELHWARLLNEQIGPDPAVSGAYGNR